MKPRNELSTQGFRKYNIFRKCDEISLATFPPGFSKDINYFPRSWVSDLCFFVVWAPCVGKLPSGGAQASVYFSGCAGLPVRPALQQPGVHT